jgi:predicted nucleic-acid-binding protein
MARVAGSIDTNIVLRLLINDVPEQHQAALRLFNSAQGQLEVADIAFMEVVFVLQKGYEFSRKQVATAIEGIMAIPKFNCNRKLLKLALKLFLEHPALSFEDCCLSVYAELNKAVPLWTFDKKLAQQAVNAKLLPV